MHTAMGWEDRDWAKFDADELRRLYGVVPVQNAAPSPPARTKSVRFRVWTVVLLLVLAVGGFAYTQLPRTAAPPSAAGAEPVALFGIRGTDPTVAALSPGGVGTVCTEEAFAPTAQGWSCLVWEVNTQHLPVIAPPQYQGPCSHLVADKEQARWTCLGTQLLSPDELPPAEPAGSNT